MKIQSKQLTKNLNLTNNEVEILDLLVDSQNMFYDYSKERVISFMHDTDFHLVLFRPEKNKKNFQMYTVKNFCENETDVVVLRNIFDKQLQADIDNYMMRTARGRAESMFHMIDTFRALFHQPKVAEDFELANFGTVQARDYHRV